MTYPPINNIYKCWKEKINPRGLQELKKAGIFWKAVKTCSKKPT